MIFIYFYKLTSCGILVRLLLSLLVYLNFISFLLCFSILSFIIFISCSVMVEGTFNCSWT
jgi:hypothetical protein